jgi:LPXTG-motif cell wall-anchored protein
MRIEMRLTALLLATLFALLVSNVAAQTTGNVTPLVSFTPGERPEGLAVDRTGNLYTGELPTGEVVRVGPDNRVTTLAKLNGNALGVALDTNGDVLVALRTGNAAGMDPHGLWRVKQDGTKQLVATTPPDGVPNVVMQGPRGVIYLSDSALGRVYRIGPDGAIGDFLDHDLLKPNVDACAPDKFPLPVGANGLALDAQGNLLVANSNKATIVRVPVNADGSAGAPSVWAGPDCANLLGADGIAADGQGGLYVAANFRNKVVHVASNGTVRTLATAADGLDFPSSVEPGLGARAGWLIITNFANFTSQQNPSQAKPGLLALRLTAAQPAAPAVQPAGPTALPRTGGIGAGLMAVLGMGAAGVGLALRRRR